MATLEIRYNVAACLAQCVACDHFHGDGNYLHEYNAWSPRITLSFSSYLLSTFYVTGTIQGTVTIAVNKIDESSGVYIIGGGERK